MCFENKIYALLKKYIIKKKRISILMCGVFNFRFVYTCRILRYLPCRPHITHMTLLHHSLTLLTSLTHLLTHTYTYTLTRSHSLILTYTHSLSLTYSPIHSLTYTYLKTLSLTHTRLHTHTYTHNSAFSVRQPFAIYIPNDPNALASIGVRFLCVEGVG